MHFTLTSLTNFKGWWKESIANYFRLADRNHDGELTEEEYVQAVRNLTPEVSEAEITAAFQRQKGAGMFFYLFYLRFSVYFYLLM
jgi:hypothetical protein